MYRRATFGLCQIIELLTARALAQILICKTYESPNRYSNSGAIWFRRRELGICFQSALPNDSSV